MAAGVRRGRGKTNRSGRAKSDSDVFLFNSRVIGQIGEAKTLPTIERQAGIAKGYYTLLPSIFSAIIHIIYRMSGSQC